MQFDAPYGGLSEAMWEIFSRILITPLASGFLARLELQHDMAPGEHVISGAGL